jgi:hypothetical protein
MNATLDEKKGVSSPTNEVTDAHPSRRFPAPYLLTPHTVSLTTDRPSTACWGGGRDSAAELERSR